MPLTWYSWIQGTGAFPRLALSGGNVDRAAGFVEADFAVGCPGDELQGNEGDSASKHRRCGQIAGASVDAGASAVHPGADFIVPSIDHPARGIVPVVEAGGRACRGKRDEHRVVADERPRGIGEAYRAIVDNDPDLVGVGGGTAAAQAVRPLRAGSPVVAAGLGSESELAVEANPELLPVFEVHVAGLRLVADLVVQVARAGSKQEAQNRVLLGERADKEARACADSNELEAVLAFVSGGDEAAIRSLHRFAT